MNRLLQLVVLAIAAIAGYKKTISSLRDELTAANDDRTTLRQQLAKDQENDAELTRRAEEAESKRAELEASLKQADQRAEELATALNDEPSVPSVDANTFETTAPPSANLQDLAFRENQNERTGNVPANPAPAVRTSPAEGQPVENTGNQQEGRNPEGGAQP